MTTLPPNPPPDWDERYAVDSWAFGDQPNDFLREHAHRLPARGRVLCLAEGEGRNAVHLAELGHDVTGVDLSGVGLAKAQALATARGVRISTEIGDLASWPIGEACWDGIVSVFAHVPLAVRRALHPRVVAGLRPGGVLLLEAYRPEQLGRGGGGPNDDSKLMTLAQLRDELAGLEFELARELEREVVEGRYHSGMAAVVQVAARKPGR
ncbi:MAG: class I SAM-dependent methyltransferase [Candidatus Eisenbacteria bacterium]